MLHKADARDCALSFVEFTLKKVDACDCILSFAEFGLLLAPKANQGRRRPTIIITLTIYRNLVVCLLLSYLV